MSDENHKTSRSELDKATCSQYLKWLDSTASRYERKAAAERSLGQPGHFSDGVAAGLRLAASEFTATQNVEIAE